MQAVAEGGGSVRGGIAKLDARLHTATVICLCFLLASTGFLSWLYRVMDLVSSSSVEFLTIVLGYLVQALGTGAYLYATQSGHSSVRGERIVATSLILDLLLLAPATLTNDLAFTLSFGYLCNALFGVMQGYYLALLCAEVEHGQRGLTFGCAYGTSTLLTWLLSLPAGGALTRGLPCLVCCLLMTVAVLSMIYTGPVIPASLPMAHQEGAPEEVGWIIDWGTAQADGATQGTAWTPGANGQAPDAGSDERTSHPQPRPVADRPSSRRRFPGASVLSVDPQLALLACLSVVMASLVRTAGFSFPAADLSSGVSLEFSRLFYGAGLVLAGFASDRDRRLGMGLCAVSLAMPLLMMALSSAGVTAMPLWALAYLLTGIYVLFSVLLFVDLAERSRQPQLAGLGMLLRHMGDALGTTLCLMLAGAPVALIAATSLLFVGTMGVFFLLYQVLYAPTPVQVPVQVPVPAPAMESAPLSDEQREREHFERFAAACELSARERDVLRLVLAEKTNAEIAGELVVSERTVKFHMTNLLKKTGCKGRLEILAKYAAMQ